VIALTSAFPDSLFLEGLKKTEPAGLICVEISSASFARHWFAVSGDEELT
jgi:hypothetical protein